MSGRWGYPPSRPRAADGIRARTSRGSIGESWWSRRFVDVLEGFSLGSRLTRGRSYARSGQVLSLTVSAGSVVAEVQGSRHDPYRSEIRIPVYDEATWRSIEAALVAQALYAARLLAGELPAEIEDVFADLDTPLFPRHLHDLAMRCSCPDWEVPCKHLAAALYVLAEELDDDPFTLLHWRGRSREVLLDRLRELRADAAEDPGLVPATLLGTAAALDELPDVHADADRFWRSPMPLPDRPTGLETGSDLLLRVLAEPPGTLGGAELAHWLRTAYARFAESQADRASSATTP